MKSLIINGNDIIEAEMPNLGKDWYINQNVYPSLEWIWRHTDGFWYLVTRVLSQASGNVGSIYRKIIIYKTKDWVSFAEVCSYENTAWVDLCKIVMDSNGNIVVISTSASSVAIATLFFDASNSYAATYTASVSNNGTYAVETTVSLQVSADNRFGVAFFQKHTGSATYSQLMYVERSAGSGGTWGTPEILGATPLRATTVTSAGAIQLFYTSMNEPIIAFLNNASATSSKVAIAKKVSGVWNIYDSIRPQLYATSIDTDNNIYIGSENITVFNFSTNSFINLANTGSTTFGLAINTNNDIFYITLRAILAATAQYNIFYYKNNDNTFHRAIRPYMQIGAVISANAYSTFGIYTVIPYSRQRLADAWHLVIRCDGAIFMEKI